MPAGFGPYRAATPQAEDLRTPRTGRHRGSRNPRPDPRLTRRHDRPGHHHDERPAKRPRIARTGPKHCVSARAPSARSRPLPLSEGYR
ncbi:hypothetical protein [Lysobacter gummosus]|uniref:hypothetical protein n=1 Tax=Lysobacter gummosus TaxID=262324 RepID=UPI003632724E